MNTTQDHKQKIVVVMGPTASGKTDLAITLAKRFDGEVVSADSRQVYRGLDIATAKVTTEEMDGVPHHLLDVTDPTQRYTAADFVRDAQEAIADITTRDKLPIIAGGTFFYIDALLYPDALPDVPPNPALRAELEHKSTRELMTLLTEKDPDRATAIDQHNRRRLVRAIEIADAIGRVPKRERSDARYNALFIGIDVPPEELRARINARVDARLEPDQNMLKEARALHGSGLSYERMRELGLEYAIMADYLETKISYDEMVEAIKTKEWQYAKRQRTWLKGTDDIHWIDRGDTDTAIKRTQNFLRS